MNKKLYLAPIRGFTNALYRDLFTEYFGGFNLAISPFISAVNEKRIKKSTLTDILPENNKGMPIIPQILGNDPENIINLAKYIYDLGYESVNWNLGCPFPMVAKKRRGSGLLPFPEIISSILEKVIPNIQNNLSIKMRIGRNRNDEIFNIAPFLNQFPLEEIIIHPRTGIQMYKGKADPVVFEKCLKVFDHQLVYNGDIVDLDTFKTLNNRFMEVNRWMIGRGALINPFLPEIISKGRDDNSDKLKILRNFHDELLYRYSQVLSGPSHIIDRMKGYWFYFSQAFENKKEIFKKIKKVSTLEQYGGAVKDIYYDNQDLAI
jgi:tRNA-dihydrouridine synthase B